MTVSFDDQTVADQFLSWKAVRQLLSLKARQPGEKKARQLPTAVPDNGQS